MHMGGFARKAHFKKWYKKSFFAVLDIMLLNALTAWNLSTEEDTSLERRHMERYEFYAWIADDLLNFEEKSYSSTRMDSKMMDSKMPAVETMNDDDDPVCKNVTTDYSLARCVVCHLDARMEEKFTGVRKNVFYCEGCVAFVHVNVFQEGKGKRKIHELFPGMTCHEILCSSDGKGLWPRTGLGAVGFAKTSHPIWQELRTAHGRGTKRWKTQGDESNPGAAGDESE